MREMKDSGIEWIGEYPTNWKVERLQWHLREIVEKNDPIVTTQVLSLTNKKGVIPYEEKGAQGNNAKESYDGYKIAYPDTIVVNSMNILIGSVGYSNYYGCVSPVYYVFKELPGNDLKYINYIMQTTQFQRELRKHANGILEIRLRVSSNDLLKTRCAFPQFEEQRRIVDYLDAKCSKIDEIIAKQEQIIEKLKEYKLSVITEAVTKGLNPDVEMKDSGVEWIGKIPSHWRISKIKQVASFFNGDRSSKYPSGDDIVSDGVLFVTSNNLGLMYLNTEIETNKYITKEKYMDLGGAKIRRNDIIYCLRGSVGKCGINKTIDEGTIASALVVIRPLSIDPDYLNIILHTPGVTSVACDNAIGIGSQNLSAKDISEVVIPIPPADEACLIVEKLLDKVIQIEKEVDRWQLFIEKLQCYKKSLIYEVVTGKKEV